MDMNAQKHLKLLGMKVQDTVTGLNGVVTSIAFDVSGCIQAVITPHAKADGTVADSRYVDVARLKITSKTRVMPVPNFDVGPIAEGKKGPAEKPTSPRMPRQG